MDSVDFIKKIQHVNDKITGRCSFRVSLLSCVEFQKLQDDILSADLIPVIEELKAIDDCLFLFYL